DDLAPLLDDVADFCITYVVFQSDAQVVTVALWAGLTHLIDAFSTAPRLSIRAPDADCGKTRVLDELDLLVHEPVAMLNTSEAALFRLISKGPCTILYDECDAT